MMFRLQLGGGKFTFSVAPVVDVIGVHSLLPDGNHILMWDFDEQTLLEVVASLENVQKRYRLPKIYVLESNPNGGFIAYCFTRLGWQKALEIVLATSGVCLNFVKFAVLRDKFTLRVSRKAKGTPKLVYILNSSKPEQSNPKELRRWVRYQTIPDKKFICFKELKVTKRGVRVSL